MDHNVALSDCEHNCRRVTLSEESFTNGFSVYMKYEASVKKISITNIYNNQLKTIGMENCLPIPFSGIRHVSIFDYFTTVKLFLSKTKFIYNHQLKIIRMENYLPIPFSEIRHVLIFDYFTTVKLFLSKTKLYLSLLSIYLK